MYITTLQNHWVKNKRCLLEVNPSWLKKVWHNLIKTWSRQNKPRLRVWQRNQLTLLQSCSLFFAKKLTKKPAVSLPVIWVLSQSLVAALHALNLRSLPALHLANQWFTIPRRVLGLFYPLRNVHPQQNPKQKRGGRYSGRNQPLWSLMTRENIQLRPKSMSQHWREFRRSDDWCNQPFKNGKRNNRQSDHIRGGVYT